MQTQDSSSREAETTATAFLRYQDSCASRLRYKLAQRNLDHLHSLRTPATVLDAAAGNGLMAEFLAAAGHSVTLYEIDPEMLRQARDRLDRIGLLSRCTLVEGSLDTAARTLAGRQFDLIICHHVLEYVSAVAPILTAFRQLAAPGGELSIITLNPVSEVIRAIVFQHDPAAALVKLTDLRYDAKWFGQATLRPPHEIVRCAGEAGWKFRDSRGIRAVADYCPQSQITEQREAELLRLEEELSGLSTQQ